MMRVRAGYAGIEAEHGAYPDVVVTTNEEPIVNVIPKGANSPGMVSLVVKDSEDKMAILTMTTESFDKIAQQVASAKGPRHVAIRA